MTTVLIRVQPPASAPTQFIAGIIIRDGKVAETAPILKRFRGLTQAQVLAEFNRKRYRHEVIHSKITA